MLTIYTHEWIDKGREEDKNNDLRVEYHKEEECIRRNRWISTHNDVVKSVVEWDEWAQRREVKEKEVDEAVRWDRWVR